MRLSENGLYVEEYRKCRNCGRLVFDRGVAAADGSLMCSDWCIVWARDRTTGKPGLPPSAGDPPRVISSAADWDMVTMSVIDSAMISICREMGISMMKTSYSTIFNEGLDFTCALALANGDLIGVADFCPSMIGGMPLIISTIIKEMGLDAFHEGDVVIHNDPHRGGLHLPEHTLIKPFFIDGVVVGFAACIGHIAEIGGAVPGAFNGEATEIFQEGLRVPPVKIRDRGADNRDVWKLLLANVRTPRYNYGDLRAMIGAVDLGERRIKELIGKYGTETFARSCRVLMDYSERRMRAELAVFADGTYTFEDTVEDDGIEARPYKIHVDVHVMGDEVVADFTGTDAQAKGPINATLGVAMGATYNAFLHLTDPSIPKNSGAFRPLRVVAPPGTIANVNFPAPEVAGNTEVHPRFAGIILGAMATCAPDRVMASEAGTGGNFVFGGVHPDHEEYFVCYDVIYGGWGARADADGNDTVVAINGNRRMNPTEVFETRYPWIVEECALIPDSGGAGRHRGGLGFRRTLLALADMTASQCTDHHVIPPWALFGGHVGSRGATLIRFAGSGDWESIGDAFGKVSPSKYARIQIRSGDRVRIEVPGGGGFGDPAERPSNLLAEDVREGFVTRGAALGEYGVRVPDGA